MAAPIIDSIDAPATVQPSEAFVVTVMARDPDEAVGVLRARVTDTAGEADEQDATVTITDDLTYVLLDTSGVGFVITPRGSEPGVFDVVAPDASPEDGVPMAPSDLSASVGGS